MHHLGHLDGLADDHADQFLRAGHDDDAVHRQRLEDGQRHIAGSRGHIDEEKVNVPHNLLPELLDSARNDGAAPDNGGLGVIEQKVDAHNFHAGAAANRIDAGAVAGGGTLDAEQAGDGRTGDVSVQHTGLEAEAAHRDGQHRAGHAFADAALAGNDADHFLDTAALVRRLMLRCAVVTAGTAAAAIVGTFAHGMFAPLKIALSPVYQKSRRNARTLTNLKATWHDFITLPRFP